MKEQIEPFGMHFPKNKIFLTSDLHLQHKNVSCKQESSWESGWREFNSSLEMNETIIANINKVVPKDGILFNLGDSLFGNKKNAQYWREAINCETIVYLFGNHCAWLRKDKELQKELYNWCGDYLEIYADGQLLCMFHYAPRVFHESHKKAWFAYAHSHASLYDDSNMRAIDVGVDTSYILWKDNDNELGVRMTGNFDLEPRPSGEQWKLDKTDLNFQKVIHPRFHPFTYAELSEIMSYKRTKPIDHHHSQISE